MNNIYYILIGYVIYLFVFYFGYLTKFKFRNWSLKECLLILFVFILISPFVIIVMPFLWVYWFLGFVGRDIYTKFTIHNLTEENKTMLRQLGFEEGKFVSRANYDYEGFRWNKGTITISYNGRVTVWDRKTEEVKLLIKQIENLPKEEKKEREKPNE